MMSDGSATLELRDLYQAGKLKPFGEELYRGLDAYFKGTKHYWTMSDAARLFGVNRVVVRAWLRGLNKPNKENVVIIATTLSLPLDLMLHLAGFPTFAQVISEVEPFRHVWGDGKYIYSALQLTQNREWRFDRSDTKKLIEWKLDHYWKAKMPEEELHMIALDLASSVDSWQRDKQRMIPFVQRQVAMSA